MKKLTVEEREARRLARNAKRRQQYAESRLQDEIERSESLTKQYPDDDRKLLDRVRKNFWMMSGRRAAVGNHILRTVALGRPFRGWQSDARFALGLDEAA